MKKMFLPSMIGILLVGNSFALASDMAVYFSKPNTSLVCTCEVHSNSDSFQSIVTGARTKIKRYFPDEEDKNVYYDQEYTDSEQLTSYSSHPTYKEAMQSCHMTIKALTASGTCSAASVMPSVNDLVTDEVGERTRFFNLSAQEQAQLQFALSMARIESNEEFYRRIADIYENKSYEDREFLLDLLSQIRPIKIKQTKIIKHRR